MVYRVLILIPGKGTPSSLTLPKNVKTEEAYKGDISFLSVGDAK